jgi:hypothetical protein
MNISEEKGMDIILVARELIEAGQLWIAIGDEMIYLPELVRQLTTLNTYTNLDD